MSLSAYFVFMSFVQAIMAFIYGMFVTSILIDEAQSVPRAALKHVDRGSYVYAGFVLGAFFVSLLVNISLPKI